MKILPEHETLITIMSKLIQIVWITFELPMDDLHISNSQDHVPKQLLTFHEYDNDEEEVESKYDGAWDSIATSSTPITDFLSPDIQNVHDSHDLTVIDTMMIERDVPCRVTGVLNRGIY